MINHWYDSVFNVFFYCENYYFYFWVRYQNFFYFFFLYDQQISRKSWLGSIKTDKNISLSIPSFDSLNWTFIYLPVVHGEVVKFVEKIVDEIFEKGY